MRWLGISKDTWSRTEGDTSYYWKYWVKAIGYKCHMNDLAAAIGLIQLKRLSQLNMTRSKIVNDYNEQFQNLNWLELPVEKPYVKSSWHLYQVKLPDETVRDRFVGYLLKEGISPGVHYIPSHLHPCYRNIKAICPKTDKVWKRLVTLPLFPDMTSEEQEKIIEVVTQFKP